MRNTTLSEVKSFESYAKDIFYKLHENPELGCKEYQTQALILKELKQLGIEATPIADTGVLGIIRGEKPGKTIAFRADMDALPIHEETDLSYKSKNDGVMHACGHDSHMAILLGATKWFTSHKEELSGNIKLFFQPDEEYFGGAERMISEGCMENPTVDAIFFGHSSGVLPVGSISLRSGSVSAASNSFTVTFHGKGTHGATPEKGNDVIVAACQTVTAVQTIASRRICPTDSVVLTVGQIHAGAGCNILPETATIRGTIRTLNAKTRELVKQEFHQIVSGIATAMGVEVDIEILDGYVATINDEDMTELVRSAAEKVLGSENVRAQLAPSMTSEDLGYFLEKVPGCYYNLGVANYEKGYIYPIHSPNYTVDPDALAYGIALYIQIAKDFLK